MKETTLQVLKEVEEKVACIFSCSLKSRKSEKRFEINLEELVTFSEHDSKLNVKKQAKKLHTIARISNYLTKNELID